MHRCGTVDSRSTRAELDRIVQARTREIGTRIAELSGLVEAPGPAADQLVVELCCEAEPMTPGVDRHVRRLGGYAALMAVGLGWSQDRCEVLRRASLLHDIGKVGIPDAVLVNEGVFTREDRHLMEAHAEIGHRLLARSGSPVFDLAAVIALSHHERVDGTGYPNGIAGQGIPIEGRVVAVADVFDALTSERRYKPAMTLNQARVLMMANRGTHFDATLLDLFFDHVAEIEAIRAMWSERPSRGRARTARR